MQQRSVTEGVLHHQTDDSRIYVRALIESCIQDEPRPVIIDLGAGTGDCSGHFAERASVIAVECSARSVSLLQKRFPLATVMNQPVQEVTPLPCDVLILTEFLEHIPDPIALVQAWGPLARHMIVSHPLNEPANCTASAWGHRWSYTKEDFLNWFQVAGHELKTHEVFTMGCYEIALGLGVKL